MPKFFYRFLVIINLASLLAAGYLFYQYHIGTRASPCDLGEHLSCSAANLSSYSLIMGVPASLLGVFYTLGSLVLLGLLREDPKKATTLYLYTLAGIPFIFYFIYAEMMLSTLCLFCTVTHVTLFLNWIILAYYSGVPLPSIFRPSNHKKESLFVITGVGFMTLVSGVYFNWPTSSANAQALNTFAQCLVAKEIRFYGAYDCPACIANKKLFGEAASSLPYIECSPRATPNQSQLCRDHKIEKTPTWTKEQNGVILDRKEGFQNLGVIEEWSGCQF
ncbi:MAG: vitamin K epoxide reductase [Parcubacteria group bacterium Gr01-1014_18]|nr:MAG: vitamin K epoxide reductase [Parcubacteria group bacterium Greene0416_36]TSC81326.1 MAG: vitamin K epoxide reductase [Parcubacteria group bacterium Gr01-1014_18]TSC99488.1 MAG: vitamin K epoxide reductase [Parcubacteria group bacterium Greene1014_20]TSD07593.1 MAG: vitamin K epoxide reductase [Parcubacteria group bacterium Greene0714_2]